MEGNMILINIYGKIEPTIISEKLGLGLYNVSTDWQEMLIEDMKKEIFQLEKPLDYFNWYMYHTTKDISSFTKNSNHIITLEDMMPYFKCVSENLIALGIIDFKNSILKLKNNCMHSPTCEEDFAKRIIKLLKILDSIQDRERYINDDFLNITYNSRDYTYKTKLLTIINPNLKNEIPYHTKRNIDILKKIGKTLDNFLQKEEDFYLFDYLINALDYEPTYNAYHLFNVMALIEMLITNPKNNGQAMNEIINKMPYFMKSNRSIKEQREFCRSVKIIRNKIAHGDFKELRNSLSLHRERFMQTFYFDEYEYSLDNWTFLDICLELDKILAEILKYLFHNRKELEEIQLSKIPINKNIHKKNN